MHTKRYTRAECIMATVVVAVVTLAPVCLLAPGVDVRAATPIEGDRAMTTVKTWQQTEFETPNVEFFRSKGDYYSLDQFIPTRDLQQLKRFPIWASRIDQAADFDDCEFIHYDETNDRFVFVGQEYAWALKVGTFYVSHDDWAASAVNDFTSTGPSRLGGAHKGNVVFALDEWMFVGSDGDVYDGAGDYDASSLTNVYGDGDAHSLLAVRDTVWLLTTGGAIKKWDPTTSSFAAYFTPTTDVNARHWLHFRDYFMLFGRQNDGTMVIYRVDDQEPVSIRQLAILPSETGQYKPESSDKDWSAPYVVHEDRVYFSPGAYRTYSATPEFDRVPIYVFDGNSVELVDVVDPGFVPDVWGLLSRKGRLLLYFAATLEQYVYVLSGGRFTEILSSTERMQPYGDVYSVGGELVMNTEVSVGGDDGVRFLRSAANNVFTSSWLDMGNPTSVKYLSRISAVISGQATDLEVKVEYRTELNGTTSSWTTAVANTDNVRYVSGEDLGARFELLQIRVTFTDNTATDPDARLESIAATYSYGVK